MENIGKPSHGERASLLPSASKPIRPWPSNNTPKRWFSIAIILMLVAAGCIHHLYFQDDDFRNVTPATHFYLFLLFGPPGIVFGLLGLLIRGLNVCTRAGDLENVIMQLLVMSVVWWFLADVNHVIPYGICRYHR